MAVSRDVDSRWAEHGSRDTEAFVLHPTPATTYFRESQPPHSKGTSSSLARSPLGLTWLSTNNQHQLVKCPVTHNGAKFAPDCHIASAKLTQIFSRNHPPAMVGTCEWFSNYHILVSPVQWNRQLTECWGREVSGLQQSSTRALLMHICLQLPHLKIMRRCELFLIFSNVRLAPTFVASLFCFLLVFCCTSCYPLPLCLSQTPTVSWFSLVCLPLPPSIPVNSFILNQTKKPLFILFHLFCFSPQSLLLVQSLASTSWQDTHFWEPSITPPSYLCPVVPALYPLMLSDRPPCLFCFPIGGSSLWGCLLCFPSLDQMRSFKAVPFHRSHSLCACLVLKVQAVN